MNKEEILIELKKIAALLNATAEQINRDANFFGESIFDSMVAIDYMIEIEQKFDVKMTTTIIEENELGKLSSMSEYIFSQKQ